MATLGSDQLHQRIDNDFKYHPATPETAPKFERMRRLCAALAHEVAIEVPPSREQSLALTKLEEVMFWANAGIARPSLLYRGQAVDEKGAEMPMQVGQVGQDRRRESLREAGHRIVEEMATL